MWRNPGDIQTYYVVVTNAGERRRNVRKQNKQTKTIEPSSSHAVRHAKSRRVSSDYVSLQSADSAWSVRDRVNNRVGRRRRRLISLVAGIVCHAHARRTLTNLDVFATVRRRGCRFLFRTASERTKKTQCRRTTCSSSGRIRDSDAFDERRAAPRNRVR